MQKRVLDAIELPKGAAFLDIGCGTGWAVRTAAAIVGPSGSAYGVDLSPKMIRTAVHAAEAIENAHFENANAEELPFAPETFDRIICTMSFHHYLNPGKAVREMARVLKPGGTVCIVDPTADLFALRWADAIIKRRDPTHVRIYSTAEFNAFFEEAGLKDMTSGRVMFFWLTAKAHTATK